jgi:hypothetical protein
MSTTQKDAHKRFLLSDSFAFTCVVCRHDDLIPEYHAPVSYAFTHSTDQLIRTLNDPAYDSYVTQQIKAQLREKAIDWNTPRGASALDALLDMVDIRLYRGWFKSSVCTHGGGTFIATKDPNRTIWIVSSSDPNAYAFCGQIGETILSGIYKDLFPDRVPEANINEEITNSRIRLAGRTISHPQVNIEADGYVTKRTSAHFDTKILDDLVVKENSGDAFIPGVKAFLANLPGFDMETKRNWQRNVGTIWAENADYEFMTKGRLAAHVLSIFVPIETYPNGLPENMLVRGTPTCPKLADKEKIQRKQDSILNDEKEGPLAWRRNYWLNARDGGDALFPDHVIDDVDRRYWIVAHPKKAERYMVVRWARDEEGRIKEKDGKPLALKFDPWADLDRVMLIDPAWEDGGDNWAVTIEGWDSQGYRFQLETRAGETGQEGWLDAAYALDKEWRPRTIGFDGAAYQDKAVQNLMRTDPRLRTLRSRMVKVPHNNQSKPYRIKQGVAEPLKMCKLVLAPSSPDRLGGVAAREEMRLYRGNPKFSPGILDAMAMAPAVARRRTGTADEQKRKEEIARRNAAYKQSLDPITGVPRAA